MGNLLSNEVVERNKAHYSGVAALIHPHILGALFTWAKWLTSLTSRWLVEAVSKATARIWSKGGGGEGGVLKLFWVVVALVGWGPGAKVQDHPFNLPGTVHRKV